MARYRGPKARICRRFGENIFGTEKYAKILARRGYGPGQHGPSGNGRRNMSEYGRQLLMKQKARHIYGVLEKQFRKHFDEVKNKPGITGDLFLARLEQRLDNVVYRLGFAQTRPQARQLVSHGMFSVNGRKVTVPSIKVTVGDVIEVLPQKKGKKYFQNHKEYLDHYNSAPAWLKLDAKKMSGEMVAVPQKDDFDNNIDAQLIVEFYSK